MTMKKYLLILLILCLITGCKNKSDSDVSMVIKKGTLSRNGATIIITDSNHKNNYDEIYEIEKKIDDKWKKIDIIVENTWNDIAYHTDSNNELELEIKWVNLYGTLDYGTYRIVKNVNNKKIYAEFVLNDDFSILTTENKSCSLKNNLYYSGNINVYSYCLDKINIVENGITMDLTEYLDGADSTLEKMNRMISKLSEHTSYWDGGSTMYKDGGSIKYSNNGLSILKCNTIDDNHDFYIGTSNMNYENDMCK